MLHSLVIFATQLRFVLLLTLWTNFVQVYIAEAQPAFPEKGEIYRDDVVPRVDIYIHPDTLQWIYNNPDSDIEWRANFVFDNGTVRDSIEEIGFRLRGNTSRYSAKKSFKVSFNTYQKGRKYYGLEKMNLNGEHNDPSVTRAKLGWDLARALEIAAPRSNHVRLYINDNYHGLYLNVEHIDEEFAQSRFGNQYGNLYKCLYPADLKYLGSNPNLYKYESGGRRAYDLKTNTAYDDYSDLAEFINILNNTALSALPCELEKVFNVQDYLKVMAFDIFTANWDGYIFNKNNFYLYKNPESGQFEYIPYDVDNTYGIDWFGVDWAQRNIYQWSPSGETRALYSRLMQVQRYRDLYSFYLNKIKQELIVQPAYNNYMDAIRELIHPYIINDPFYPLDYGFNENSFLQSYDQAWGAHVKYGIRPYMTARLNSIQQQLELNPLYPVINYLSIEHSGVGNPVNFRVKAWDDQPGVQAWVRYRFNQSGFVTMPMTAGQDDFFTATLSGVIGETTLKYHIQVQDAAGNILFYPCESIEVYFPPVYTTGLYINEFLASNQTGINDSKGEFEDWIELFNGGQNPIWLGDKYMTDKLNNPTKWQLPDHIIFPGEYLIIWADEDPEQGPFHADFKLSADGESIGIFNNMASSYSSIDNYNFGPQQTDISLGRSPDGSSNWVYFDDPSPGSSNAVFAIIEGDSTEPSLQLYPNPAGGHAVFLSERRDFTLFHISGIPVLHGNDAQSIDVSVLDKGIYLLKTAENENFKIIIQ